MPMRKNDKESKTFNRKFYKKHYENFQLKKTIVLRNIIKNYSQRENKKNIN